MTRERIDALEKDKRRLLKENSRLQGRVDQLAPENRHLQEALGNAESNSVLATILIVGVGGFLVSYAAFTGRNSAGRWANLAAGMLACGDRDDAVAIAAPPLGGKLPRGKPIPEVTDN